jgi:hypothetical protein
MFAGHSMLCPYEYKGRGCRAEGAALQKQKQKAALRRTGWVGVDLAWGGT